MPSTRQARGARQKAGGGARDPLPPERAPRDPRDPGNLLLSKRGRKYLVKGAMAVQRKGHVVYFVQMGDGGPIKIGTTRSLDRRFRDLQRGVPYRLVLRYWTPGGLELERAFHCRFANCSMGGEWFEAVPDLVNAINVARSKRFPPETAAVSEEEARARYEAAARASSA